MNVRTDEDAAMQAQPVSAQWRTVEELHRLGWQYQHRDASGRRIIMTRRDERCIVDEEGNARRASKASPAKLGRATVNPDGSVTTYR